MKSVVRFCLDKGDLYCLIVALNRVLDQSLLKPTYVEQILLPLISDLRYMAKAHDHKVFIEPFAHAFRTILRAWVDKVLGPRPT